MLAGAMNADGISVRSRIFVANHPFLYPKSPGIAMWIVRDPTGGSEAVRVVRTRVNIGWNATLQVVRNPLAAR